MLSPSFARADGNEVVVVYNSQMPESEVVARHYAQMRGVPEKQVYGFALTTDEVMSRDDFTEKLQKPLADRLEKKTAYGNLPGSSFTIPTKIRRASWIIASWNLESRYAVLCYGVPLKIAPDLTLREVEEKLMRSELRRNEAAVDSELAWLPLSRVDIPLVGVLPNFVYGVTNRAALTPTNGILLVARLDGPTADIAAHLVDKAMDAEEPTVFGAGLILTRGASALPMPVTIWATNGF